MAGVYAELRGRLPSVGSLLVWRAARAMGDRTGRGGGSATVGAAGL